MTVQNPSPCPDDRLALAARGAIDAAEWEALKAHLDGCADCTVAWIAARAFDGSAGAEPADERMIRGAARAALVAVRTSGRPRRSLRSAATAAAAVILLATAASAGVFIGRRSQRPAMPVDQTTTPPSHNDGHDRRVSPARPLPAIDVASTPAVSEAPVAPQPSPPAPGPSRATIGAGPPDGAVAPSRARALFARATAAREAGRVAEAISLFQRLAAQWPDTPEGKVSRVSLGDLLAAGGDADGALASFEAYLSASPTGPLVPEALAARAHLLSRLGRGEEARRSWDELRRRFPGSPYLSRRHAGDDGQTP